jgi:cytochrome c oxidase assembly factor CtaG
LLGTFHLVQHLLIPMIPLLELLVHPAHVVLQRRPQRHERVCENKGAALTLVRLVTRRQLTAGALGPSTVSDEYE